MTAYKKKDARAWARQHLVGCSAVTIPSYSADLKRLNERGIRHDVERVVELDQPDLDLDGCGGVHQASLVCSER